MFRCMRQFLPLNVVRKWSLNFFGYRNTRNIHTVVWFLHHKAFCEYSPFFHYYFIGGWMHIHTIQFRQRNSSIHLVLYFLWWCCWNENCHHPDGETMQPLLPNQWPMNGLFSHSPDTPVLIIAGIYSIERFCVLWFWFLSIRSPVNVMKICP